MRAHQQLFHVYLRQAGSERALADQRVLTPPFHTSRSQRAHVLRGLWGEALPSKTPSTMLDIEKTHFAGQGKSRRACARSGGVRPAWLPSEQWGGALGDLTRALVCVLCCAALCRGFEAPCLRQAVGQHWQRASTVLDSRVPCLACFLVRIPDVKKIKG